VSAPVDAEPETAFVPVQSPLAIQLVAFVLLHVSVELAPFAMLVGDAENVTVGAVAGCCTTTVALAELDPPSPVHVSVYVAFAFSGPTLCVPLVACAPDQAPDAIQDVAFVELHVSDDMPPLAIVVGFAVKVVVGGCADGGTEAPTCTDVCDDAVPPRPTQLSV